MAASNPDRPKVFVREATGLVREVSGNASLVAQWMIVTGGYPIFILTYLAIFPGANFFLAFILGFLPMFALLGVYTLFGISMPRAGGDYVYVTRGLNSFVGFVSSFALAAAYMVSNGIFTVFGSSYVGYQLSSIGIVDNNPSLLALGSAIITPTYSFTLALIILVISLVIAILRPGLAWETILWAGVIAVVCSVIMFIALAGINQASFQAVYDQFIASNNATLATNGFTNVTSYQQTITAGGWTPPTSVFGATLAAFPIALYTFAWSQLPTNWAGEIKQVRKNLPFVLLGGIIWILVYFELFVQLSMNAFGQPFLTAWSALATNSAHPLQVTLSDYIPFFAYLIYRNPIIMWIMFLALFIPVIFEVPPLLIGAVRYVFAWSFDRVLPEMLSRVSERTHTPVIATAAVFVVNIFGAAIQAFNPAATPSVLVPVFIFGYMFPALAAIVFPYRKKEMYETSFLIKRRVAKIPVLSWLGILALIGLLVGMYGIVTSGLYPLLLPDYLFYVFSYGLGIVIFVAAYIARKNSGLPLELSFKEIPPE
jgi:amino acid transporter